MFTFTEAAPGALESGYTYKAVFGADLNGDGEPNALSSCTLKVSFPRTVPKVAVTVKRTGAIDITRPGTAFTLTPTVKNWYRGVDYDLVFFRKDGRKTNQVSVDETPFVYSLENGVFTVTLKDGWETVTSAYSVKVKAKPDDGRDDILTSAVALPVKQGKVKAVSSVTSGILYKNDKYSRLTFTLSIPDGTVAPISYVDIDTASANKFRLIDLGGNTYALEYLYNTLPAKFKASTVKLYIYVEGCEKAAASVGVKVSYK